MKKLKIAILAIVLIISLSACDIIKANQGISLKEFERILTQANYTVSEERVGFPETFSDVSPVVYVNGNKTICYIEFENESEAKSFFDSTVKELSDMPVAKTSRTTTKKDVEAYQMDAGSTNYVVITTRSKVIYSLVPVMERESMIEDLIALGF